MYGGTWTGISACVGGRCSIPKPRFTFFSTESRTSSLFSTVRLNSNLIAQGHGNQDIGRRPVLTHGTVRNYVSSIFSKLQLADRAQAIVQARRAGFR